MGQAQDIISEILAKIDHCELCEEPVDRLGTLEIYTIGVSDFNHPYEMSKNIIVLCPSCKRKFDSGIVSRKHLRACVMLREPVTSEWLKGLFDQYGLGVKHSNVKKGLIDRTFYKLANNHLYLNNLVFVSSIIVIIIGIILFSVGFQSSGNIEIASSGAGGTGSPMQGLFSQFVELAGVVIVLIGTFFQLGQVKKPSSIDK